MTDVGMIPPGRSAKWRDLLRQLVRTDSSRIAIADLSGWLATLDARELRDALESPPPSELSDISANMVAAMVEHVCAKHGVAAPAWTQGIEPLSRPVFASNLESIRLHLLTSSPAAFRRRNLFVDTVLGGQV